MGRVIHVEVTSDDIRRGLRGNCLMCPVARAIARALKFARLYGWEVARVDSQEVMLATPKGLIGIPLPGAASRLVRDFDFEAPVYPIAFKVEVSP